MKYRASIAVTVLSIAFFSLAVCERRELMDTVPGEASQEGGGTLPVSPIAAWMNDGVNEPKMTGYAAGALTISWPPIRDAVRYDVYTVSTYGPPVAETKFADTADTVITTASNVDKQMRIKAVNSSDAVIDAWAISGAWNILQPYFVSGYFYDDFEDGAFNPAYYVRNATQAAETGGYLQLNQNVTDNGPSIKIGYDPEGKRYVHMSLKWFQHRSNQNYSGGMRFVSSENNNDIVALYNAHDEYQPSRLGTIIDYTEYEPHDYSTAARPRSDLDSTEYFDVWFTWDVIIDLDDGSFRVKINGVEFGSFDTPYIFNDKVVFYFDCYGWGTGHYVRIDYLLIESSDSPY